jgi:hypothetical protein
MEMLNEDSKHRDAARMLSAFDIAYRLPVEVGQLRQAFLRQASFQPSGADIRTDQLKDLRF